MSWAEEDWMVGLSGRVLQKVKELQIHKERLSRENKQKQLQLDNIHTSLEKQTVKYEEVRGELQSIQRELQSVQEEAQAAITSKERLTQELHTRQAQVCSLEGQLDAAHTLNNKLTQEIKRLEAELEKLQNSGRLADTTLFSTPCWNTTSPWEHSGSKQEERSGQRDVGPSRAHHIRQQLQFSDMPTASRQQTKSTPHRHPSDQSDIFSTPSASFPWERDDSRPASRTRRQPSPQTSTPPDTMTQGLLEQRSSGKERHKQMETDISSSELQSRISSLEESLSEKVEMLKSIRSEMVQTKKELAAKELSLQKTCEELSMAQTRMAQDRERASETEHRLKQLQEELKCQRQNAESSRLQHQQRTKELEKQHQRDVAELQKERQCLEKQHQQEVNKLNQELQQARTTHNALQAQADKLSLQKQALDKELDTLKEKLKWTEDQLKESQKKEAQTQTKLTEAVREAEGVAVTLEQSRKRERALEEEGRRLKEEQTDTLRLLKELQEQKSSPAPPQQPVQFCPVGQSFSSQASSAQPPRPLTHSRRPAASQTERKTEERVDASRAEMTASYPSDREPGEGIDAEHITSITKSECLQRSGQFRERNEVGSKSRDEAIKCDISDAPITTCVDGATDVKHSPHLSPESTHVLKSEQTIPSEDLMRENAQLRSELSDVREELQRRLEDLEAQRRAEAEARTRLKQLSRKHANQAGEREEKDKEWRAKLENEKVETERLKRANAALVAELKISKEEQDKTERTKQEEDNNVSQEDRESELIEQNIQLKNQLVMVKAQLALEREERKQEEEERIQIMNTEEDVKNELSMKLAEIMADVEDLTHQRNEELAKEERLANSPLLTLLEDELNSNTKLLPSQEEHLVFCESANQNSTLISKETVIHLDGQTGQVEDNKQNYQEKLFLSGLQSGELDSSELVKEVEQLRRKYAKESERANKNQVKFDALQIQVTRQTKELTRAFEKQTQHIAGLLAELQEKEITLFSQGEELMKYRQELDVLKKERKEEVEEKQRDKSTETSELQPEQEKECVVTVCTADPLADVKVQNDSSQPKIETRETPEPEDDIDAVTSEKQQPVSVDLNTSESSHVCEVAENPCSQNEGMITELIGLRRENQLLKQKLEDSSVSDTRNPTLQTESENRDESVKQSQSSASLSQFEEQGAESDIMTEEQESLQGNVKKNENEGQDSEREEMRTMNSEDDQEEVSEVNYLQQQVEALQREVRALSEKTEAQTQELAVWRLASQPASTINHLLPSAEYERKTPDQVSAGSQSQSSQQLTNELIHNKTGTQGQSQTLTIQSPVQDWGSQTSQGNITVIREDELSLCCSSNKLRGRTLFSRIQNSNLPEPKSHNSSKKTATCHENNQNKMDQESEKENLEINLQRSDVCPEQNKVKKELIQITSQKMTQLNIAKDPHKVSGTNPASVVEFYTSETRQDSFEGNGEKSTTTKTADKNIKTEIKSVSSQTDESLYFCDIFKICVSTQTEEDLKDKEESEDFLPVSVSGKTEPGDKMLLSSSFPIPADPARLAERIRRSRTQLSAAFDDTEYEPYGLPEVVMKGFADIPSGPSCPYIVRRGLLGTAVVPVSQKEKEEEETD